jgi:hypothetical protein
VVERIHRYGDRERNVGNLTAEREAREAAREAQEAPNVDDALRIEMEVQGQELQQGDDEPVIVGQEVVKRKRGWLQRLLGWGDDDDDSDNS